MVYLKLPDTVVVFKQCKCCAGKGIKSYDKWRADKFPDGSTVRWNTGHVEFCIACAGRGGRVRYLSRGRSLTPNVRRQPGIVERVREWLAA